MQDIRLNRRTFTLGTAISLASLKGVSSAFAQETGTYTFAVLGLGSDPVNGLDISYVVMLARLDFENRTVRTLTIPRNLYVELPGRGWDEISHAYPHGIEDDPEENWESGAELALDAISHNFGVDCDGVLVVEIERMAAMIDSVGGIEVNNPVAFSNDGFVYAAGSITLTGEEALTFTRAHSQDGEGDLEMRRHLVIVAVLEKLQQPDIISALPDLGQQASNVFNTDISSAIQLQLLAAIPTIQQDDLAFTNIDEFVWSDTAPDGVSIVQGDWSTLPQYVQSWLDGEIE